MDEAADEVVRLEAALASMQTTLNRIDRETALEMGVGSAEDIQVLRLVAGQGPIRVGVLAQLRGTSAATASARLNRLEERGLVVRERLAGDRRAVEIVLTPAGWDAATRSFTHRRSLLITSVAASVNVDQIEQLAAIIDAGGELDPGEVMDSA